MGAVSKQRNSMSDKRQKNQLVACRGEFVSMA
jgi:hypothetical protein